LIHFYKRGLLFTMGSEKFCLRWNDFESNISGAFRELRDDKDFFDVTLVCDNEQIQAHKVILSACSTFFRNVLRSNPHQHPLLYLKGVRFSDLQAVLNFMYHGEVNVAQEELNSFLAVAEDLKVKGLTQNQSVGAGVSRNENTSSPAHTSLKSANTSNPLSERDHTSKRPRPAAAQGIPPHLSQTETDDEVQEVVPVKSEPRDVAASTQSHHTLYTAATQGLSNALATPEDDYQESYEEYDQYGTEVVPGYDGAMVGVNNLGVEGNKGFEQLDAIIAAKMSKFVEGGKSSWRCLDCGKDYKSKGDASRHVEAHHVNHPGLACNICLKILKNRESLRSHMTHVHKNLL